MNRYLSSERWRKVEAGCYESPDGNSRADKQGNKWVLMRFYSDRNPAYAGWAQQGTFLTLADCQEHAERLERSQRAAWWGFREGVKKANDASV